MAYPHEEVEGDVLLEYYIGLWLGLTLGYNKSTHNSKYLNGAYPTTLCKDLLRHEDGIWTPFLLSKQLMKWTAADKFPLFDEWTMELEGIVQVVDNDLLRKCSSTVSRFVNEMSLLRCYDGIKTMKMGVPLPQECAHSFLVTIGPRVLVALLGVRTTVGCIEDRLPPTKNELLSSFDIPHKLGTALSVGARALSKHYHRGEEGWWGTLKGNDIEKNKSAHLFCEKILSNAVWTNLHQIVGSVRIIEFRVLEGYGARWAIDECGACVFRGFLEPQTMDGHQKGWKH
jgi:hypothetical protein